MTEIITDKIISAVTVIEGWSKIIEEDRSNNHQGSIDIPCMISLKYRMETLEKFLDKPEWFLIYVPGFSLAEMATFLGDDYMRQPCCCRSVNGWWLHLGKKHWTRKREKPGYYLLNTAGLYKNLEWERQEKEIENGCKRTSTCLIINLNISFFLSKKCYFQKDCYHWGPESNGKKAKCISYFDGKGFLLFNRYEQCLKETFGTFVVKEFDSWTNKACV